MSKTAIVIGATGLVGSALLEQLLADKSWHKVRVFGRTNTGLQAAKLEEHIVDFTNIEDWQQLIQGHSLFICIGTTLSQAGSKAAMRAIDLDLPLGFANYARRNQVEDCLLISSLFANAKSPSHYLRIKGQLENQLACLGFKHLMMFRPGPLLGERKQARFSEQIVAAMQPIFAASLSPLRRWRGIEAERLAATMLCYANKPPTEASLVIQGEALFKAR
ncbi:NAD(P)H-binding protein [Agarivorans aestuarii]|uniref:NAD(P)H-binding protein n=1 Tax=Agarivorans aestuarii TaxID=1563703 RepID=A0ABU7GAB4_9ALTE|nr:NAD(P)H-binding protein [Agarivorans aestuarii]MEE1675385.1 NAD(P)H-binding protein [Agarivorans aestuarii]